MYEEPQHVARARSKQSGKAIASLILGIFSLGCAIMLSIPAIILGALALNDINRSQGRLRGKEIAVVGIVMGGFTTIVMPCIMIPVLLPAIQAGRNAARMARCQINLRDIGVALHHYHESKHSLPPAVSLDGQGRAVHSWRALISPFFEEGQVVEVYDFNEPWDGPNNKRLAESRSPVFACPADTDNANDVSYVVVVGQGFVFQRDRSSTFREMEVGDGLRNTILAVEMANSGIKWTEPRDLTWDELATMHTNRNISDHPDGFSVLLGDASVEFIPYDMPLDDLHALFTVNGGEPVAVPRQ